MRRAVFPLLLLLLLSLFRSITPSHADETSPASGWDNLSSSSGNPMLSSKRGLPPVALHPLSHAAWRSGDAQQGASFFLVIPRDEPAFETDGDSKLHGDRFRWRSP